MPVIVFIRALLLAALVGAGAASIAMAQSAPTVEAQARLPDGRTARVYTFGDGLGYRLEIEGALYGGAREGRPVDLVLGDVDADGAPDAAVIIAPADGADLTTADVWDLSVDGPILMHVSGGITAAEDAIIQLRREVQRFTLGNGLASLRYASETVQRAQQDGGRSLLSAQMENWIGTAQGALIYADVARARTELAAADVDEAAPALTELNAALEARARFAATTSARIHD